MSTSQRGRSWCLTGHYGRMDDPTLYDPVIKARLVAHLEAVQEQVTYYCYGEEVCPETERPHLQAFVRFENARRLNGVIALFPGFHVILAKGSAADNIAYCSKTRESDNHPNDVFVEFGNRPDEAAHLKGWLDTIEHVASLDANEDLVPLLWVMQNELIDTMCEFFPHVEDRLEEIFHCEVGISDDEEDEMAEEYEDLSTPPSLKRTRNN